MGKYVPRIVYAKPHNTVYVLPNVSVRRIKDQEKINKFISLAKELGVEIGISVNECCDNLENIILIKIPYKKIFYIKEMLLPKEYKEK